MKKIGSPKSKSPSQLIDARIKELGDWRGKMLSQLRNLVWNDLHRRDIQKRRKDDLHQRGGAEGSLGPFQLQS